MHAVTRGPRGSESSDNDGEEGEEGASAQGRAHEGTAVLRLRRRGLDCQGLQSGPWTAEQDSSGKFQ